MFLVIVVSVFGCFVANMELQLARLGYQPTGSGGKDRWIEERFRANSLGAKALVIIGASRIQLGIDLKVLKKNTGLEPVQLAIDGSSPHPLLANLAKDPGFQGNVIVDYYPHAIGRYDDSDIALIKAYEEEAQKPFSFPTGRSIEKLLTRVIHDHLRSYSDGANPMLSLEYRILGKRPPAQYLVTMPDRSRRADYRKVPMPAYYYARVARTLGLQIDAEAQGLEALLLQKVKEQVARYNDDEWRKKVGETRELVKAIRKKGGKVVFLGMPSSGMVREIEERRYPKARYWDYFEKHIGASALYSNYIPVLKDFVCPDGSHLDMRDQSQFTENLSRVLSSAL